MYANGTGVPKNDQQAFAWFKEAAEQGHVEAQAMLGAMYAKGTGVPKNAEWAYFWLLLSSAQGNEDATKLRDRIEPLLTPQQRANAQAAASTWQPRAASNE